jgi:hypothetical protein
MYEAGAMACGTETGTVGFWSMFRIRNGASNIAFEDVSLRSDGLSSFNEHTYLIQIGDSTQTAAVSGVRVTDARLTGSCGDDIYMIGNSSARTTNVEIKRSQIGSAGRRGVTLKYSLSNVRLVDNLFEFDNTGAIDVDFVEAIPDAVSDLRISRNVFVNASTAHIEHVEVNGSGNPNSAQTTDVVISDNLMIGGGIEASRVDHMAINSNVIIGPSFASSDSDVNVFNAVDHVDINFNIVFRNASALAGIMVWFDQEQPRSASVSSNVVYLSSAASGILMRGVKNQAVLGNLVVYEAPATSSAGIDSESDVNIAAGVGSVHSARIQGNMIIGNSLSSGIFVDAQHTTTYGDLLIRENVIGGSTVGVSFARDGTSSYLAYPLVGDNIFDGVTTDVMFPSTGAGIGFGGGLMNAFIVGGNVGGPVQFVGEGTPVAGLPGLSGSTFLRRDVATGSHLYVKEGATWASK